jgi:PAS domain S-box-containing protein
MLRLVTLPHPGRDSEQPVGMLLTLTHGLLVPPPIDIFAVERLADSGSADALVVVGGGRLTLKDSGPEDQPWVLHGAASTTNLMRVEELRLRYAAIVESSDDAIIAKDLDGVMSAWNAAAERMFGYTEHEAIGQPIALIIPADLCDEGRDILRRLRAGERVDHYETVRVSKAGERIDVSLTISPLRDPMGRIIGCSKIARDITKAKEAEAALRHSEQRLAREVAGAKTLQSISTRLISESTPESLFAQILGAAMELMASDCASVQMLAADHASLSPASGRSCSPLALDGHVRLIT